MSPSSSRVWSPQLFLSREGNQHGTRTFYCKSSSASSLNCLPVCNFSPVMCLFSMSLILTFLLRGRREYYEIFLHFASILFLILSFERIFLVIYMICSDMNCLWSARWRTWTRGCCWRCGRRACSGTRPSATTGARLTPSPSPSRWVTRTTLREFWSTWSFLWAINYFSFGWIE